MKSLKAWLPLVFIGSDQESKARYIEEWFAILSEPSLTLNERRLLWRELATLSLVLKIHRIRRSWKTIGAVTLVALFVSPIWLLLLLPLFLIPRTKVE